MPVVDRVLSRLGLRRKEDVPIIDSRPSVRVSYASTLPGAMWTQRDYAAMAAAGYKNNSDVYACVSLIAGAGKQVKFEPAEGSNNKESLALLDAAGGPSLIESWLSYLLLSGNAYIEIARLLNGGVNSVYLDSPAVVTAMINLAATRYTEEELVELWKIARPARVPEPIKPADMVHSKLFNPLDPIYGMAPLEAAMLRVDAENEGATLMKRTLQRGFSPGWIEAAKDSLWEEPQVNQLKERIKSSKTAGEELFLENATWHQMGFNPVDSGVADAHVLSKRDIASVFHVDPALIGDTTARTYATYRESRQALYMEAVLPLLSQFRDDWNQSIGKELRSPIDFDKDQIDAIAGARAEAVDRVTKLWTSGLATQAEARRELHFDPAKPGDVFYAPANFLPLGEGETAAPKPVPVPARRAG